MEPLPDQIDSPIVQFTANGAYDGKPTYDTYDAVTNYSACAAVVIPPRSNAVKRQDIEPSNQRDCHRAAIATDGRMKWQATTGYGKRSLVETAIGRCKSIIGRRLRARDPSKRNRPRLPSAAPSLIACLRAHARNPFLA